MSNKWCSIKTTSADCFQAINVPVKYKYSVSVGYTGGRKTLENTDTACDQKLLTLL